MKRTRHATYTLDEVAELTGYDHEQLRSAIEQGNLGTISGTEELRISGVELERWWHALEGNDQPLFTSNPE